MRVLLVDDEPPARRAMAHMLATMPGIEVVGEAGDGLEALDVLADRDVDLVLLDIQMPVLAGLELAARLSPRASPAIVFVTAWAEHAVRAFELGSADYLLKPVAPERLAQAIERARAQLASQDAARRIATLEATLRAFRDAPTSPHPTHLWADTGVRRLRLPVNDIEWFGGDGDYVQAHVQGRAYLLRERLRDLEQRLPRQFLRIHRSTIANLDAVEAAIRDKGQLTLLMKSGERLSVGRRVRARVHDVLRGPG